MSAEEPKEVSLEYLHKYAASEYSATEMMNSTVFLGTFNKAPVMAEHPCSDLCPQATVRIIYLDVPETECEASGGTLVEQAIPWGITQTLKQYCSPFAQQLNTVQVREKQTEPTVPKSLP